jgi:hypothetical protein
MVDVLGMCFLRIPFVGTSIYYNIMYVMMFFKGLVIHIGVGFEVAYLYGVASSKARSVR